MNDNIPASAETPTSVAGVALELVREHGLIVLALIALMWQVYFLGTLAKEQQERWRAEILSIQASVSEDQKSRNDNVAKLVEVLVSMREIVRTTQMVIASVEEECLTEKVKRDLEAQMKDQHPAE